MTSMRAQDVLDGVFTGLERTVPTALILLVPILALALKLVHRRRRLLHAFARVVVGL